MSEPIREIWIKLEGVLAEELEIASRWAIGQKLPHAEEVLALATAAVGNSNVTVYGDACQSPNGQRAVQRWMRSHGLDAWVSHFSEPPAGVEVIDKWPILTDPTAATSTASTSPDSLPESPPTES